MCMNIFTHTYANYCIHSKRDTVRMRPIFFHFTNVTHCVVESYGRAVYTLLLDTEDRL